jgi:hypothetical protein
MQSEKSDRVKESETRETWSFLKILEKRLAEEGLSCKRLSTTKSGMRSMRRRIVLRMQSWRRKMTEDDDDSSSRGSPCSPLREAAVAVAVTAAGVVREGGVGFQRRTVRRGNRRGWK